MKKNIISLFIISFFLGAVTSCYWDYSPINLQIDTESNIEKRVKDLYGKYGTITKTDFKEETLGDMFGNEIQARYRNNTGRRKLTFSFSDGSKSFSFYADDRVQHIKNMFADYFDEFYQSNFYSLYFKNEIYDYYYKEMQDFYKPSEFKLLITTQEYEYDLDSNPETYSDFNSFIKNHDPHGLRPESLHLVFPIAEDNTATIRKEALIKYLSDNERNDVDLYFHYFAGANLEEIKTIEDIKRLEDTSN